MKRFPWMSLLPLLLAVLGLDSCYAGGLTPVKPTAAITAVATASQAPAAASPTPGRVVSPARTLTLLPTPSIPAATAVVELPEEHLIRRISGHKQYFSLGCEAAAAKDWANYFGKDFNEFEFQYKLPTSDNPDFGFVGDVNAPWGQVPPYGYGVHAGPVADLLNAYGIPARAEKNYTLNQIIVKIAADEPVIAWVIGNMVGGVPYEYSDKEGRKVTVAAYEHVVILTGYSEKNIRYMTNGKFFEVPKEVFLNSWGVLGNMVIVAK